MKNDRKESKKLVVAKETLKNVGFRMSSSLKAGFPPESKWSCATAGACVTTDICGGSF